MVILQRCSNGHMYILYSMVNRGVLFLVYSISYLLNLLIFLFLFILHTAKVLHTQEREDFMPVKIEQVCQSREGE